MNPSVPFPAYPPPYPAVVRRRFRWRYVLLAMALLFMAGVATIILSFLMTGEARTVRKAVYASAPFEWDREIEFGVGRLPVSLARSAVLKFVELPREARAAVQTLRSGDVGIYRRRPGALRTDSAAILNEVRAAMDRSGWYPLVTVSDGEEGVAIFVPNSMNSPDDVQACVLVIDNDEMVIVSGRANAQPLMELIPGSIDRIPIEIPMPDFELPRFGAILELSPGPESELELEPDLESESSRARSGSVADAGSR